jgi:signal peptide peptidase SppA
MSIPALRRALADLEGEPLAIGGKRGTRVCETIAALSRGEVTDEQLKSIAAGGSSASVSSRGPRFVAGRNGSKAVAWVSVRGIALYDLEFQPYCFSTLLLAQTMNQLAADPEIGSIVLDIDSPGGAVVGNKEAGDAVYAARKRKKVVALINPLAASAAYWIASQASEIVSVPSGDLGSIGVFMMHTDCSAMLKDAGIKPTFIFAGEHKTEGNSFEPLSEDALAYFQSEVNTIYNDFVKTVARGRNTTVENVIENFGKGRCLMAADAKRLGMIDAISTVDRVLASTSGAVAGARAKTVADALRGALGNGGNDNDEAEVDAAMIRLAALRA